MEYLLNLGLETIYGTMIGMKNVKSEMIVAADLVTDFLSKSLFISRLSYDFGNCELIFTRY